MKLLEKNAEDANNIPPLVLMEEASSKIFEQLKKDFDLESESIAILAGAGNNGGDALSLARKMFLSGIKTGIYIFPEKYGTKLYELEKNVLNSFRIEFKDINSFDKDSACYTLIIDGIFGIGFKKRTKDDAGNIFGIINDANARVVSIDVPSGLDKDSHPVNADITYSIGYLKNSFFNIGTRKHAGIIRDLKISFDVKNLQSYQQAYYLKNIEPITVKENDFVHKYSRGGVMCIGGSPGKYGSIIFTAESALRSGCGISVVLSDKNNINSLNALTKNIVIDSYDRYDQYMKKMKTIVIGPGLDPNDTFKNILNNMINEDVQFVLDASFFTSFDCGILAEFKNPPVLTPHSGEFKKFFKEEADDLEYNTIETVRNVSQKYNCIIILKDSFLTIGVPSGKILIYDNPTRLLAQAGSGDIFSGILGGILSQGYPVEESILESIRIFYKTAEILIDDGYKTYSPDAFIDLVGRTIVS